MFSLIVTAPFFAKVDAIFRPFCAALEAALVPRACVSLRERAFASSPETVTDPRKLLWIVMWRIWTFRAFVHCVFISERVNGSAESNAPSRLFYWVFFPLTQNLHQLFACDVAGLEDLGQVGF